MRDEKQEARRREIEAAAYEALKEQGYKATSMLAIAKRASASNETLYRWYGSKSALFASLVETNAHEVSELLRREAAEGGAPLEILRAAGPLLLRLVTGDRAVMLNRAAVGDVYETATLGKAIAARGKEAVLPLLAGVFAAAQADGSLTLADPREAAGIYVDLLVGDMQIQRVIGVRAAPDRKTIEARSQRALALIVQLFGSDAGARKSRIASKPRSRPERARN